MDFSQRRGHLFTWILISFSLALGFITYAYHALQNPLTEDTGAIVDYYENTLDSLYIQAIDTEFVLKDSGREKYLQAHVLSPQPFTSLKVYKDKKLLGIINSKGKYILQPTGEKIGDLSFKDAITGKEF